MNEPFTVYAVEGGEYSDYRIDSLWSTREAAETRLTVTRGEYDNNDLAVVEWTVNDPDIAAERTVWQAYGLYRWTTEDNIRKLNYPTDQFARQTGEARAVNTADPYGVVVTPPTDHPFPYLRVTVTAETEERANKVCTERLSEEIVKLESGFYGDMWQYVTEYVLSTYTSGAGTRVINIGGNE